MKRFKVKIWNDVYNAYYEKEHNKKTEGRR